MTTRMKSQLLLALAALIMIPAFVTPLWSIGLTAPQYPEGLGMHIYIDDIVGHEPHDLQNINILNHYIGMQPVDPATVPELEIMPIVLGALIVTGLLAALIGRPWVMAGWLGAFLVAGMAGLVDFYLWNIDYGHNLSPDAAIKIPDMTYSPPIIGTEQILNIRASSWPHLGSFFLAVAALLAAVAVVMAFRARFTRHPVDGEPEAHPGRRGYAVSNETTAVRSASDSPPSDEGRGMGRGKRPVRWPVPVLAVTLAVSAGCQADPPPQEAREIREADRMVYGQDQDPFCGGEVEEVRWGGELQTRDGEVLRFRSVECLAAFLLEGRVPDSEVERIRVVDFPSGWKLIDLEEATFLQTPNLSSPDRLNLMAIQEDRMIRNLHDAYTGRLMGWDEVLGFVGSEWNLPHDMGASTDSAIRGRGAS